MNNIQEWIEELQEMLKNDLKVFTARGEKVAAKYVKTLTDDIEGQIQNWKDEEIWWE